MFATLTSRALAIAMAAGFLGFGGSPKLAEKPAVFVAESPHGVATVLPFEDATVSVNTTLGALRFRLMDLVSITGSADDVKVETVARDEHHGVLVTSSLRYRDRDGVQRYEPGRREPLSLQARHGPWPTACIPPHIEIHLASDDRIKVQRDGLRIPVRIQNQPVELSAAGIRALRLIADSSNRPATVIVSFLSGRVERGELDDPTGRLRTRDLFGNRVDIPFHAIRSILGERSILTALPVTGTRRHDGRVVVRYPDGRTASGDLDPVLFQIDTSFGSVEISSELVLHMEADGDARMHTYTVAGERLIGRVSPHEIALRTTDGQAHIRVADVSHMLFPGPSIPVPDGWMVATFAAGDKLLVRFPDRHPPYRVDDEGPIDGIQRITPAGRRTLMLDTADRTIEARTDSARVELTALSLADHVRTRWSLIEHLAMSRNGLAASSPAGLPTATPATEPDAPANPPREPAWPARSAWTMTQGPAPRYDGETPRTPSITVPTGFGALELPHNQLAALHTSDGDSALFIETVLGDCIALTRIRRRQREALTAAFELDTFPEQATVRLREQAAPPDALPVWRLLDGSVLRAELASTTLRFSDQGRRAGATDIDTENLDALVRTGGDRFLLNTHHGPLEGRILTTRLELTLAVTGEPIAIDTGHIESMTRAGGGPLPPALDEIPGLPSKFGNQVLIEGDSFMQGNPAPDALPEETPPYPAVVSTFWMDRSPVTIAQFARFAEATGHTTTAEQLRRPVTWRAPGFEQTPLDPVTCVSWLDAAAFCNWRSRQAGRTPVYNLANLPDVEIDPWADGFRLPTEAEWEFAARERGREIRYPWGNAAPAGDTAPANYRQANGEPRDPWLHTSPVMAFPPNGLGLYDLAGNVWEWCQDWFHENAYQVLRQRRPQDPLMAHPPSGAPRRSMRGGAYNTGLDFMRTTSRGHGHPVASSPHVGFRCVRSVRNDPATTAGRP